MTALYLSILATKKSRIQAAGVDFCISQIRASNASLELLTCVHFLYGDF